MTLFSWLFVGHLVGDWLLQNDWMARNKGRAFFTAAGFCHFVLYTLCLSIMFWSAAHGSTLPRLAAFSLLIFVSHWLIDALSLAQVWGRFIGQTNTKFVTIAVDQIMHLLVLVLLIELL